MNKNNGLMATNNYLDDSTIREIPVVSFTSYCKSLNVLMVGVLMVRSQLLDKANVNVRLAKQWTRQLKHLLWADGRILRESSPSKMVT